MNLQFKSTLFLQALLEDQSHIQDFVTKTLSSEAEGWAALHSISEALVLQASITQQLSANAAATSSCQLIAEKVWESLESKEMEYVKTLQGQASNLEHLLSLLSSQAETWKALALQQSSGLQRASEEVVPSCI